MEIKNTRDLQKIIKFCRKNGIISLKSSGFEITLDRDALFPERKTKRKALTADTKDTEIEGAPSDLEQLFWSVPPVSDDFPIEEKAN